MATDISLPLEQFRIETYPNGLIHLVFDCPGRTMNVFSNKAIRELGLFADWLKDSDVRGVVVRSGKDNAFCAGADLTELGVAYDMIVAARAEDRFDIAYNHFFPLSHAIRRLERAGKPIAAAIGGIALGGGCELTLGCHYRVAVDSSKVVLGLPEVAVGLLPGAGGTQRMPRLVGVETGLDVLLRGVNLSGQVALNTGLVHELVVQGEEVAAAERWLLSDSAHAIQPWDRAGAVPADSADMTILLDRYRHEELTRMLGHEPAPLAILDCVALGIVQPMDGAIRAEMSVFAGLIQRVEARNMIQTMFLGKQDYERAVRKQAIPDGVALAIAELTPIIARQVTSVPELAMAGLHVANAPRPAPVRQRAGKALWIDGEGQEHAAAREGLAPILSRAADLAPVLSKEEMRMVDYALVTQAGFPAYLGGPFARAGSI